MVEHEETFIQPASFVPGPLAEHHCAECCEHTHVERVSVVFEQQYEQSGRP